LVEVNQRIPNRDEAALRPAAHGGEPSAASRVFDERPLSRGALDPAPGSQAWRCLKKTLDSTDDVIQGTLWSHPENARLKSERKDPYVLLPGDRDGRGWCRRFRYLVSALLRGRRSRRGNDGRANWRGRWSGSGDLAWGIGWRLGNGWRARGGGQLIVRHYANHKYSLAGFDFVAGGEHGLLNLCAIQMSSVGASFVDDAAAIGTAFDGEVHAGHMIVVGNGKLGAVRRSADEDGPALISRITGTR
jgi:hypothetical protein